MPDFKLTPRDWIEIYSALELKLYEVQAGRYDNVVGEVDEPRSETSRWAAHLRSIMKKIGPY